MGEVEEREQGGRRRGRDGGGREGGNRERERERERSESELYTDDIRVLWIPRMLDLYTLVNDTEVEVKNCHTLQHEQLLST